MNAVDVGEMSEKMSEKRKRGVWYVTEQIEVDSGK